jgi:CheY-like chemotaxis protein
MTTNILVVEDDEHDLSFTLRALKLCSVDDVPRIARDGEEALHILTHGKPNLILLDLKLPKIDGFTVLKHIRATPALEGVPVVVVSGSVIEADRVRALILGANNYVVKNMDFAEFAKILCLALSPYVSSLS